MDISYRKMIEAGRESGTANEETMWKSIDHVSELLHKLKKSHQEMYWDFIRKEHANIFGSHYTPDFARHDVSKMFHITKRGERIEGEHWNMMQAKKVAETFRLEDECDVYVAINAHWHDKIELFTEWFGAESPAEERILEDAVKTYFMDDDAPSKNIWHYMQCVVY